MPGSIPGSARADVDPSEGLVAALSRPGTQLRRLVRTPTGVVGTSLTLVVAAVALTAGVIAPGDPLAEAGPPLQPPGAGHLMGTDNFGRDLLSAVVHGLRTSLAIALGVMAITLVVGVTAGIVAGYRGGLVDDVIMRITEVFQAIPLFFIALLVVAFFGAGLDRLILLLGLFSWADEMVRVVRAESLSLRQREFVEAARASGAPDAGIMLRHILPNVLPVAVVIASLVGSRVILIEAALSFLGLGDPNTVSLGSLLFNAQSFLSVAWWMSVFPGAAIAVAVLGFNLLGDAVNDALDPRSASRGPTGRRGRRLSSAPSR